MHKLFGPFLETMETILIPSTSASSPISSDQASVDKTLTKENQKLRNRLASLEAKHAKLSLRLQNATDQRSELRKEAALTINKLQQAETEAATQRCRAEKLTAHVNEIKVTLKQMTDEVASLRTALSQTQARNQNLSSRLEKINLKISEEQATAYIEAANEANNQRTEFITSLNTTLPNTSSSRTPRDRLGDYLGLRINDRVKLMFLIDGYNVILRVPKFDAKFDCDAKVKNDAKLKPFRKILEHDISVIQAKLGDCKINLYYDGPTPGTENPFRTSNIKIIYSGGKGDNRADNLIIGYANFFTKQCSEEKLIVVTDDNAIREEAAAQGSFILSTADFIALA